MSDQTPKFTDPERKKLFRGLFRGTGKYYSGVKWTWYQPIYAGRPVLMEGYTLDVQVKDSEFAGGRSVKETYRYLYVDIDGNPIATRDESYISADRHGSKKSGKYSHIQRQHWTEEELEKVDEAYEAEERRGADPRWFDDVTVGDELPPIIKGPLGVVDIISMHMGWGWGGYGLGPLKFARSAPQADAGVLPARRIRCPSGGAAAALGRRPGAGARYPRALRLRSDACGLGRSSDDQLDR